MRRAVKSLSLVTIIFVACIIGAVAFNIYGGGWEVTTTISKVHGYSSTYGGAGVDFTATASRVTIKSQGPDAPKIISWGDQRVVIDTNGGEYQGDHYPSGPPDVQITKGLVRHVKMGMFGGLETCDKSVAQQEYSQKVGDTTYYYEWHIYAFEVEIRTLANVKVSEGTTHGSYGKPVTAEAYITFTINPWDIIGATTGQEFTDGENKYRLVDGWAGIMSARVAPNGCGATPDKSGAWSGEVPGYADNLHTGGIGSAYDSVEVKGGPSGGQALSMSNPQTGTQISGYQYSNPAGLRNVPQQVDVEVPSASLLPGAWSHYTLLVRDQLVALDCETVATVLVDVLQVKGYNLVVGVIPPKETDNDFAEASKDWGAEIRAWVENLGNLFMLIFWVAIILIGAYLIIKLIRPRSTKVYVGRK